MISELPKNLTADALFFDGFEHVFITKKSLPKFELSDILHLTTCQELFKDGATLL